MSDDISDGNDILNGFMMAFADKQGKLRIFTIEHYDEGLIYQDDADEAEVGPVSEWWVFDGNDDLDDYMTNSGICLTEGYTTFSEVLSLARSQARHMTEHGVWHD